jgi:FtsZ-binding cell division protein ZapB
MNQNTENIRIDELLEELHFLRGENESLKSDNEFLDKQNRALKLRCSKYCLENKELRSEIEDMKFTKNFLSSDDAGRMFARDLLGKTSDIAEEEFIANGENHYAKTCGDDY